MSSVLFFLFMVYFRLNNEDIWFDFFHNISPSHYSVLIHTSLPSEFIPPTMLRFVLVPTVNSAYYHLVEPMNQLLKIALNMSVDQDHFIFLSENTIPIKPFNLLVNHYLKTTNSEFCITPTNQWLLLNRSSNTEGEQYAVKHHQWITLNRHDASTIVTATSSTNNISLDVSGRMIPSPLGHAEEEFWFHLFLYSRFVVNNQSNVLRFPYPLEQGSCITYVYWPNYHPMSLFRKDVDMLRAMDVEGQHIIRAPLTFLAQLKDSHSFFFVRKLIDNGSSSFLPPRMKKRSFQGFYNGTSSQGILLSLREAIAQLRVYS